MKRINWCSEEKRLQTGSGKSVWISSEYFSGFRHGPTIRHICRDDKELFYLQMDWDGRAKIHTGELFAISSSSTKAVSSLNTDPDFKLLEPDTSHPDQIRFAVDGKMGIFDEAHNRFMD